MIQNLKKSLKSVFKNPIYIVLATSLGLNFLALDYILFSKATTFRVFIAQNVAFYNWASLILSIVIAVLFGISITMLIYILKKRKKEAKESAPTSLLGTVFGAIASGCPVCGAWLLPLLGVAGSLAVFPLQGLEIKVLAIGLLIYSISQSVNIVLGICKPSESKNRNLLTFGVFLVFIAILLLLPRLPQEYKVKFQKSGISAPTQEQINLEADLSKVLDQVNPKDGFALESNYGNIGYRLVEDGVIDFEKFKAVYDRAGSPLTKDQLKIFSQEGLEKPIVIDKDNSYFLLNLFWAFGLANENPILTEGQITKYGEGKVGSFASTGGWSIATKDLDEFYAQSNLASLNEEQQARLQNVAENVYRPCCGNSTAFPDCNHGMALLGVLELMASNNATEDEMFEAAKYFSSFWFPSQALDVATYFKITEDKSFEEIDARVFVSEQFFSGRGWSGLKGWLNNNLGNTNQSAPQGGGCGVESGAPAQAVPQRSQQVAPQGGGGCGV